MNTKTRALVESAVMVALAFILSMIKVIDLPYGGSVTVASMLPVVIISYRWGLKTGLLSGLVYALTQQLMGLNNLSYVTTWQSVLAIIMLDYIVAFIVCGLGGVFRKPVKNQALALGLGAGMACIIRYVCHVISGATVWAGISIPTAAATIYSLIYNATYMLPETIITVLVAVYLGSTVEFRKERPARMQTEAVGSKTSFALKACGGLAVLVGLIADIALVFSKLQNAESGEFDFTQISSVNWVAVVAVTAVCTIIAAVLYAVGAMKKEKN